jgi:hypothetical protein
MKVFLSLLLTGFFSFSISAQVGFGTTSPDASAALDVSSNSMGMLPPRMTTNQRDAISSPAAGLMIYCTSVNDLQYYNGTNWISIGNNIEAASETGWYNNVIRYEVASGSDRAQLLSSGDLISGKSWTRSGSTISISSQGHGLASGDFIVVRNMGATDYLYCEISNVSSNAFDITDAVNSGDVSGAAGAYIPAFSVPTLGKAAVTVEAPATGNCQLISLGVFIDISDLTTMTITVPANAISNGAGSNSSVDSQSVPFYKVRGINAAQNGYSSMSVTRITRPAGYTSANLGVFKISGGLDTFGSVHHMLKF